MSNLSYVAEHQENLNIVQIMLHGPNLATQTDLAIETSANPFDDSRCHALVVSRKDPAVSCAIVLPVAVHPGQSAGLITQSLHLEAKLSAIPLEEKSEHIGINTVLRHALSAEEMRRLNPVALTCAACGQHVVDTSGISNPEGWKNLPSEHWAEMIEVWMCHQDPKWTSDLAEKTKRGLWPTEQTVLLGGSYMLVHPSTVNTASLKIDEGRVSVFYSLWPIINLSPLHELSTRAIRRPTPFSNWWSLHLPDGESVPVRRSSRKFRRTV